jgi:hypothetical protein
MLDIINSLNLIRYLVVARTGHTLVTLADCFSRDISAVLGHYIADQLPSREARDWRKARALWEANYGKNAPRSGKKDPSALTSVPRAPWPIEVVFLPYPVKSDYGLDEPVLWEIKLLGTAADHGLFLEYVLPALERAATQACPCPVESKGFWGQFRIHAIYAARGLRWEPLVMGGELNLAYRPTPIQWAEGLTFTCADIYAPRNLAWLTPFDLGPEPVRSSRRRAIAAADVPTVEGLIHALMQRVARLLPVKNATPDDVWALLPAETQAPIWGKLNRLRNRTQLRLYDLHRPAQAWYGRWIGTETFAESTPPALVPYLELASILHVGHFTHFGCGTFTLR